MAKKEREGTEWGLLASGEGANRIAIQYLAEFQNKYLSDRILLFNTTASDIRPERAFGDKLSPELSASLQKIKKEKTCIFGAAPSGAGNVWKIGENEAEKDFETIRRYVANSQLAQADVILGMATLGGGTGNGSLPFIISQLRSKMPTTAHGNYISLGIWPLNSEASQRHFNAVCGFSRLLNYNGKRNSDMAILVHNSSVAGMLEPGSQDKFYQINHEIIRALDMMVAPSGKASEATIDIADYRQIPSAFGVYHFTPCVSWGNDPGIIGLEAATELALRSPMCPIGEKTATMAYFIVRAPESHIRDGTFTQEKVEEAARKLSFRFMAGTHGGLVRYCSLISKPNDEPNPRGSPSSAVGRYGAGNRHSPGSASEGIRGCGDCFDVMVLLGGFDLKKLLSGSIGKFRAFSENLKQASGGALEVSDEDKPNIRASLRPEELERIETALREYSQRTDELIRKAKRGDSAEEELDGWMKEGKRGKEAGEPPPSASPRRKARPKSGAGARKGG